MNELDRMFKLKGPYSAYFNTNESLIISGSNYEDYEQLIEEWPSNAFGGIESCKKLDTKEKFFAFGSTRSLTLGETDWLKTKHNIIDIQQLGNGFGKKFEFSSRQSLEEALLNGFVKAGAFEIKITPWNNITVSQCFKCQCLYHTINDCTSMTPKCKFCAQNHMSKECIYKNDKSMFECVNCSNNDKHRSDDRHACPHYDIAYESAQMKQKRKPHEQTSSLQEQMYLLNLKIEETTVKSLIFTRECLNRENSKDITILTDNLLDKSMFEPIRNKMKAHYKTTNKD